MQDNKPFIPVVEKVPADIYTETEPNPDTLAALGPLAPLAGTWYGRVVLSSIQRPKEPEAKAYKSTMRWWLPIRRTTALSFCILFVTTRIL